MRNFIAFILMMIVSVPITPASVMGREIAPIVSVDWLEKNLANPKLVVVDIRKVEEYRAGHIPGAYNVFHIALSPSRHGLRNELPWDDDLRDVLSSAGIAANSLVVVAGDNNWLCDRFSMTRVAMTLIYAGVPNVAVLDGGTNKWETSGKAISTVVVKPKFRKYRGKFRKDIFIDKIELASDLRDKTVIVDARERDYYKGNKKLNFVARAGHIKGAVNLPVCSQIFKQDGEYKSAEELKSLVEKTVGKDLSRKIVLYCDTGKEATGLWFLLTQVFGYTDVKVYDGSCQEWAEDQSMPMEK